MSQPGNTREPGKAVKPERGRRREGSPCPPGYTGQCQYSKDPELNITRLTPSLYWNEDAHMHWLYPANIGTAIINGRLATVLIDSGARMNVVMLEFVKARGLAAGSIQDLNNHAGCIPINRAGGKRTEPLGYVMIRVQIPYAPSYDEDQVALIVEDPSLFSQKCPVILGTLTIFQAVQVMKESEMDRVEPAWQHVKAGNEYTHFLVNVEEYPEDCSFPTNTRKNPVELDEKLLLKKKQVLLPFSNTMVHCKTQATQMHGYKLHVMTHAPYPEDKFSLPNGVYILKTYTELKDGSRNVSMVLRNLTSKTILLIPWQMLGPDSRCQRGAQSRALVGAGQGIGGSPRKGGP